MAEKPKKSAAKRAAFRPEHGPHSTSIKQTLWTLGTAVQLAVPSILDTDPIFRRFTVNYLLENYRKDVLSEIAAGVKKLAKERAHA